METELTEMQAAAVARENMFFPTVQKSHLMPGLL